MSVGSISFWQQDRNFWSRSAAATQAAAQSTALINLMSNAITAESQGLSSIANQTALSRVNTELTAAVQSALQGTSGSPSTSSNSSASGTSSSSAANSGSSSSSISLGAPAIGTGTVPLTTGTSLFTLGILAKGTVTVGDGTNTTTYKSTGTDTVGDLLNAINANVAANASVAAWLNASGELVVTGKIQTDTVTVGGSYASAVGFGTGNNVFQPTVPAPSASTTAASSNTSGSPGSSSSSNSSAGSLSGGTSGSTSASAGTASTGISSGIPSNSANALQTGATAEILLASNGLSGNLLNMLA